MKGSREIYFIDTNIFLRVLVKDDERSFAECVKFLQAVKEGAIKASTATLVLAEVHWTLVSFYQFPKEKVVEALQAIVSLKNLKIADTFSLPDAIGLYESHNVKFVDAVLATNALVTKGQATIVSYDKDFDKLRIPRKEPAGII